MRDFVYCLVGLLVGVVNATMVLVAWKSGWDWSSSLAGFFSGIVASYCGGGLFLIIFGDWSW